MLVLSVHLYNILILYVSFYRLTVINSALNNHSLIFAFTIIKISVDAVNVTSNNHTICIIRSRAINCKLQQ